LLWKSEWSECQHGEGLSMFFAVWKKEKKSQGDKSGEYGAGCNKVI
jgi:hypothetical protein